jgi:hypothetical protein
MPVFHVSHYPRMYLPWTMVRPSVVSPPRQSRLSIHPLRSNKLLQHSSIPCRRPWFPPSIRKQRQKPKGKKRRRERVISEAKIARVALDDRV